MSKWLAKIPKNLPASGIRDIMVKASTLEKNNRTIIHLEVGQPNFETPQHIKNATIEAIINNKTQYVPNDGIPELKIEIANYYSKRNFPSSSENICVTTGSMLAMYSLFVALINPNDEVLLPLPGFPNYYQAVLLHNGKAIPYYCHPKNSFLPKIDEIKKLITNRTKVIVINNPNNPTGAIYPTKLIEEIIQLANENNIFVISDEIYSDIIFDNHFTSAANYENKDINSSNIAVVSGISKAYSSTGFRVGWVRANKDVISVITKLQEPIVSCGTSFSQYGALAAIQDFKKDCIVDMTAAYKQRRDKAVDILTNRNYPPTFVPAGAFYFPIFIPPEFNISSLQFALSLLESKGVAIAPGTAFNTDNSSNPLTNSILESFCRVSLANSIDNVANGINLICDFMDDLHK